MLLRRIAELAIILLMWGDFYDDWLSVAGLVLTVGGFIATLINVVRAKRAATRAQEAVDEVRNDIRYIEMVADVSRTVTAMEEITRLQREGAWSILPERYATLRKSLIEIRSANKNLPDEHKASLQNSIQLLKGVQRTVEEAVAANKEPKNVVRLNEVVFDQIDDLHGILTEVKIQIGA